MSKPGNTPAACPRLLFGGEGPRACSLVECPSNLRTPPERGPGNAPRRIRLQLLCDDTCARDVRDRAKRANVQPTRREIGVLMGISPQAVEQTEKRVLVKLRRKLKIVRR